MRQSIATVALVVRDYDEALAFYVGTLGFTLIEDTYIPAQDKRWVTVAPPGSTGPLLLLVRAVGEEQSSRIGNQTGGRVDLQGGVRRARPMSTGPVWTGFQPSPIGSSIASPASKLAASVRYRTNREIVVSGRYKAAG